VLSVLLLIAARPAQAQTETVLHDFTGGSGDGAYPQYPLTSDGAGNLYGTTSYGGLYEGGTVFELSPNGSGGWNEKVLYSFCSPSCADGLNPYYSGVIFDTLGNLYGTAANGGANGYGVVFELSPVGANWTETVLYSFTGGADGATPESGLIFDPTGNLYGTNSAGVFELSPSGGGWTEQVIYGVSPSTGTGLTMDAAGNIYGVSASTVFELASNGNGGWSPTVIHNFTGFPKDGSNPHGTPVLDKAGNLYGTTHNGGAKDLGTVYKLSPGKNGWKEKILHSFASNPWAGIVLDAAGNMYGTTIFGGKFLAGTVFELAAPVGTGGYEEKVLWSFNGTDGQYPYGNLILDSAGNLYGTANGGSSGVGVVFEVNPSAVVTTTTLTSSPNPSTYGEAVTFTATVTSSAGAPPDGETVSFMKGKTLLGTGLLSGGSATFTTPTLKVGTTSVTAAYGGDSNFYGSTSNTVKQVVEKAGK